MTINITPLFAKPSQYCQIAAEKGWLFDTIKSADGSEIKVCTIAGWLQWLFGLAIAVQVGNKAEAKFVYVPWKVAKNYVQEKLGDFNNVPLGTPAGSDPKNLYKLSHAFVKLLSQRPQAHATTTSHEVRTIGESKPTTENSKPIKLGLNNPGCACYISSVVQALRYCPSFVENCTNKTLKSVFTGFEDNSVEQKMNALRKQLGHNPEELGDAQQVISQFAHVPLFMTWDELQFEEEETPDFLALEIATPGTLQPRITIGETQYELRSAILFANEHYTTAIRNSNDSWIFYDDSLVKDMPKTFSKTVSQKGKIFLYERVCS